jgi:parallel beta-helix repeat protein
VGPSSSAVVRGNQIRENGNREGSIGDICGIFAEGTAIIEGNIIENNRETGILVTPGSANTMIRHSNKIIGNNLGILILSPVVVDSNMIQNNKHGGILIRSDNTSITRNEISGNRQGVSLEEQVSNITISQCDISNNQSGIATDGEVKVRKTIIKSNTLVGVDIHGPGIDLGRDSDAEGGYNIIGLNQVCNISNMTSDTVYACRNYWDVSDTAKIDETISDDDEDPSFGPVIFYPILADAPTGFGQIFTNKNDVDLIGLDAVYPNPFTDQINISYHVDKPMSITTRVIDLQGRVIVNLINGRHHDPGNYTLQWHAQAENNSRVPAGVYVILMEGDELLCTRKVQILE